MFLPLLRRLGFAFLLGLVALAPALAQQGPHPQPVRAQVSFILIAGAAHTADTFTLGLRGATIPAPLAGASRSRPINYEGAPTLVLFAPDTTVEGGRKALTSVQLPPGSRRVLVLLAPGDEKMAYRAVAVDEDPATLPPGSLRFLNYSGKAVSARIGEQVVALPKGPSQAFPLAKGAAAPVELSVQLSAQEENGMQNAYSSKPKLGANERLTFILLPSTKVHGRGLTVSLSRESITPPSAPANKN